MLETVVDDKYVVPETLEIIINLQEQLRYQSSNGLSLSSLVIFIFSHS